MSVYATTHVWHNSQHHGTELLLVLALADQANDEGVCWPSVGTLARKTRLSERSVQNLMSKVLASGEVVVVRESRGGHSPRVYRVVTPPAPEHAARPPHRGEKSAPRAGEHSAPLTPARGATTSPQTTEVQFSAPRGEVSDAGVQSGATGVQISASRGEAECTQTVRNRQEEPSLEPVEPSSRASARDVGQWQCSSCGDAFARGDGSVSRPDGSKVCTPCATGRRRPPVMVTQTCPIAPHTFVGSYSDHIAAAHRVPDPPPKRPPPVLEPELATSTPG